LDALKLLWEASVATESNQNTQAFIRGRWFRLNIVSAFKTAYHATVTVVKVKAAAALAVITPWELFDIGESTYAAVTEGLNAVSEDMNPLSYVACVVLGSGANGLTAADWEARLNDFITSALAGKQDLPWYLRLSAARVEQAAADLKTVKPFTDLIKKLNKGGWLSEEGGKFKLNSRDIVWGFERK